MSDDGDSIQAGGPTANIRLYLRASNLPKKAIINQQPDTLCRVSILPDTTTTTTTNHDGSSFLPPPVPPPSATGEQYANNGDIYSLIDETEVVHKSSNPGYTTTFSTQYEYGSQLLFFVDIFAVRTDTGSISSTLSNIVNQRAMKLLGRAVFDVQDVLGSRNNVKARRLRTAGVVYAHIEVEQQQSTSISPSPPQSPSRSLISSITSSSAAAESSPNSHMLKLQLRADSLVHTHSNLSKVVPTSRIPKPDTYYEISRPSSGTWIVVYRSPPIKESISPMWDESVINLSSFHASVSFSENADDLNQCPIMITVYKVKRKKCKQIGSIETTIQSLIDACTGEVESDTETESSSSNQSTNNQKEGREYKTFHLRPTAIRGTDRSDEITGNVTVVNAHIDNSNRLSQRFLSIADNDNGENDDNNANSVCEMMGGGNKSYRSTNNQNLLHVPKFSDYVAAGTVDIDFCVAVDFTSSNGDPRIPGTQHYSRDGMMNDYEEAIVAIGETISKYSKDQEYSLWGFGAKFEGVVRHIFQCGDSSTAHGVDGVLDAYRKVWETDLIMSGPTILHSVLKAAAARAKKMYNSPPTKTNMKYCVLMILTDGIVADLESMKQLVRSYRDLQIPLSIIVIGIGRTDFTEFHKWSNSSSAARGRFVFIEFRQYQFDTDTLTRKALRNVPYDIVDYFLSRNILPT